MPTTATGWLALSVAAAAGTTAIVQHQTAKSASKAQSAAQERAQDAARKQYELEAGEYQELTEKQMKIQAMQSQTRTLVELIDKQDQAAAPQVYTLPVPQSKDPIGRINAAIDDFIKGRT